ncbi:mannosylglucosylglycerate synthase [Tepiditoga spiralis]|uniref:Mannosylglucosylglycerate synthase n=1 Tax=Tepiditoga spiralis TaxID=2108365 RepID=A0A7G1G673_9BACT|nr:glycosyltransferase family 4 protein [Tepiditoga spiralis]BBE30303.1 mannosylglucosylglycerate synthase [Tepiditoga spiralis]
MKIGLLHYRVGETDGVSLEMNKWKNVLESMGNEVFLIGGEMGNASGIQIPLLAYSEESNEIIKKKSYISLDDWSEDKLEKEINKLSNEIKKQLKLLKDFDLIVVNNIWSLGHNLSAAKALWEFCHENKIKVYAHHHDFYWERDYYKNPTSEYVKELLNEFFPPLKIKHIVINSIAQKNLYNKKKVNSYIVPNVFDFDKKLWKVDLYNKNIYSKLGIKENDIVFLQATRVVKRKGIELAIDTLSLVQKKAKQGTLYNGKKFDKDSKIYLLLPGLQEEFEYTNLLKAQAEQKNVNLLFANDICEDIRKDKKYSLWDFYAISDFVTYPSILEGFGNQFLEALFAMKPILMYEYPVFKEDIAKNGFKYVSLGDNARKNKKDLYEVNENTLIKASNEIISILYDKNKYNDIVQNNFNLGKKYYSYQTLEKLLLKIIY